MAKQPEPSFNFDFAKMLAEYKVPGIDVEAVVSAQRKNFEALANANKTAFEGMQAVYKRQVEILRQTLDEVAGAAKDMTEAGAPQDKAAKQTELVKEAFERSLSNLRELSEMVARSNYEAFDLLNKRFAQSLDELRETMLKSKK